MASVKEKKTDLKEIEAVYIGRAYSSKGQLCAQFVTVAQAQQNKDDPSRMFDVSSIFSNKQSQLPRMIGGIYTIKGETEGGRIVRMVPGQHKWTGDKWPVKSHVALWHAKDEAEIVARRARAIEKDQEKDNLLRKHMEPLRVRYAGTDYIGKLALEVVVLRYLRGGW